jgi:hypothetical protein
MAATTPLPPPPAPTPPAAPARHAAPAATHGVTPLWAVFSLTFLCSIGSGIVYAGIFFLAKHEYGFTPLENFVLGLLYGVMYIPAALGVGPLLRRLARAGVAPRAFVRSLMVAMGSVCLLPWLVHRAGSGGSWPLWVAVGLYSPLSGMLWPVVESFLAGGRSEAQLRSAVGRFNITWSSATVAGLVGMGPFLEHHALLVLVGLSGIHFACTLLLAAFPPAPASHEHHAHERPLVYHRLLTFLRLMLPVAYTFTSTLSPYLPGALTRLGVQTRWETPAAAVWYSARVLTFFAMERWHGWHGRWTTPVVGSFILLLSFAALLLAPALAGPALGLPLFLAGLAAFGVGVGIIYASALYYAMEVGSSGVDAGGMHETLIGIGYSSGPACGLIAMAATGAATASSGALPERATFVMLAMVCTIAVVVGGLALHRAFHLSRRA